MNEIIVSPTPLDSVRNFCVRAWRDPESRSIVVGILGVLVVHLLLWLVAPRLMGTNHGPSILRPHASSRQFNIEIAPQAFPMPLPKPAKRPPKFVETNPNAPDNIPDKTDNVGAQNQQAAQEKPNPDQHNDRPAIEGQKDIHSSQIVSGTLEKTTEQVQPAAQEQLRDFVPTAARQEQNPLSGTEKISGKDDMGFATGIGKPAANPKSIPEKIEGVKNAPLLEGATALQPQIDPKHPRSRPMIVKQQHVRPAIFEENKFGTSNIGAAAYDARWSNYGAYMQRLIETVQIEWDRIMADGKTYPTTGTHVSVRFRLDKMGKIANILEVEGNAGDQWEKVCNAAITNRAPYGEWTDDMISVLGESQEITFTFYYQ